MKRFDAWVAALISLCANAATASEEFAYAVPVTPSGQDALQQLEVPQAVYEGVVRADLADLRVVNASGEPVPHALRPRPAPGTEPGRLIELPYFPLTGSRDSRTDTLEIRTERTALGTIVRVTTPGPKTDQVLRGYLVDVAQLDAPLHALELDWRVPIGDFSGTLQVEASDDLQSWRTLSIAAPLLRLTYGERELVRKTVELPAWKSKYLRLSWPSSQPPLELTRLRGRRSDVLLEPSRQWKRVTSHPGSKAGEYRFDPEGRMPVDRLRVSLPNPNTLVSVRVQARSRDDQPWQTLSTAVLYRLVHEGREVANPDLPVPGSGWSDWQLVVDQRGGGIGAGTPVIEVGWVPQQLVFVARGASPFRLVYGSASAKAAAIPIQELVPGWRSDAELTAQTASTGARQMLAGPRVLTPQPDYKVWALWGSLALGVAILAWMAWQLARQLRGER